MGTWPTAAAAAPKRGWKPRGARGPVGDGGRERLERLSVGCLGSRPGTALYMPKLFGLKGFKASEQLDDPARGGQIDVGLRVCPATTFSNHAGTVRTALPYQ